jgi:hypothetical protein
MITVVSGHARRLWPLTIGGALLAGCGGGYQPFPSGNTVYPQDQYVRQNYGNADPEFCASDYVVERPRLFQQWCPNLRHAVEAPVQRRDAERQSDQVFSAYAGRTQLERLERAPEFASPAPTGEPASPPPGTAASLAPTRPDTGPGWTNPSSPIPPAPTPTKTVDVTAPPNPSPFLDANSPDGRCGWWRLANLWNCEGTP